jgi:hypothetical protein
MYRQAVRVTCVIKFAPAKMAVRSPVGSPDACVRDCVLGDHNLIFC